jgi:hypothetical protein
MKTILESTWAEFEGNIELADKMPAADADHPGHDMWENYKKVIVHRRDRMLELARKFSIAQTPPDWLNQFDARERAYFSWLQSKI